MATGTRKCCGCKDRFSRDLDSWRRSPVGQFHSSDCQIDYARAQVAKQQAKRQAKADRQKKTDFNELKKKVKHDLKWWEKKAQATFNKYIRLRDADLPCISCGAQNYRITAGHYKTVGAHPELRYHPMNAHGQCWWNCNKNKSGNIVNARIGIIARHGEGVVDLLESHHKSKNYKINHLEIIDRWYKRKIKRLTN